MGSSEYLLRLLKIMSFAPVRKELQITKRQRTSLTALSKKYIYPSVITSWKEESLQNQTVRVRCSSYSFSIGSRLLSLSFFLYSRITSLFYYTCHVSSCCIST